MNLINIEVAKYYGNLSYYPFMPLGVFRALEKAFLAGAQYARVSGEDYAQMTALHAIHTAQ